MVVCKLVLLLLLLYLFISSLGLLASSFRLLGGKTASSVFQQSAVLGNPVVGLMIGVLVTVLVQSSSTSSSIIVSMVAADFMDVRTAIPIIMGANIGTSVTNTLVSLGQMGNRDEFERAFAGATVHDIFNWMCVLVLLPLEVLTGYLYTLSKAVLAAFQFEHSEEVKIELLSKLTKPFTKRIIQLDKSVLEGWALNDPAYNNATLLRRYCSSVVDANTTEVVTCNHIAAQIPLGDTAIGVMLMVFSLVLLCSCLVAIVKILGSLLKGSVANVIQTVLNADLPYVPWLTGYLAILVGAVMTFLLQSSSIFTSSLTPLVGLGLISVDRVYPLTLGSNLGTTTTALLAALSSEGNRLHPAIQVALVHLFFNMSGILLYYVIPFMRIPVPLAKMMGRTTAKYRWFAVFYMIISFGLFPMMIFAVSLGGPTAIYSVLIPLGMLLFFVILVNVMQAKCPKCLPSCLRSWHWLPLPLRSLQPLDRVFSKLACCCCKTSDQHLYMPPSERYDFDDQAGIQILVHADKNKPSIFSSNETCA
ncbi:sodium-dependent phosphate transport protein 2B [Hyalella azteca]|uniref:Sodium-dependent phosphate transport protein 2B n=1 Tax=Hyalella azteca TaxID=294128 RepID=A0A8B7NQS8_HYAAZ|nr:sodium-dependent phosphate transport protein 2B [Hyalella azteca]